jgi:hypothetical protein
VQGEQSPPQALVLVTKLECYSFNVRGDGAAITSNIHGETPMPRTQTLFAGSALLVLLLGLLASRLTSGFSLQVGHQRAGIGLGFDPLFYCVAAFLAVVAALYTIEYIPFSPIMMRWHFWMSLAGLALCVTGAAIFWFGVVNAVAPWRWGLNLIAFSFIAGVMSFVSVQLWFVFDLTRAILNMHKS